MSKIKLSALSPEEQLDVLSRVYLREVTKQTNKVLSGYVRRAGGEYNTQLNMGKVKNMFLSGSIQADDFAYAVGNSKYETNRFSITGAFYNYLYRSKVIDELKSNYSIDRAASRAYGYARTYGYEPFYTYTRSAFVPTAPSSIVDEARTRGQSLVSGLVLDEIVSTSTITLDDFSKEQIKLVKHHIKKTLFAEMKVNGFSTHDIEPMLAYVENMRVTPYINKNKTGTAVKKPSKKLEGFLIGIPTMSGAETHTASVAAPAAKVSVAQVDEEEEIPVVIKPNPPKGMSQEEFDKRFIDPRESVIVTYAGDLEDEYRNPIAKDQNGNYCYVDGTPFTGDTIYKSNGGVYMQDGIMYDDGEGEDEEEIPFEEEPEEDEIRVINGVRYNSKGYMISDGGHVIDENEYCDDDVETTRLGGKKQDDPVQ